MSFGRYLSRGLHGQVWQRRLCGALFSKEIKIGRPTPKEGMDLIRARFKRAQEFSGQAEESESTGEYE